MLRPSCLSALFLSCAVLPSAAPAAAGREGPAPYPPIDDESAWPGRGPIRVFPWMIENREAFWRQRENDRGAIVFAGDSLTAGWKDLARNFPEFKVANRGIGGDTSRGLRFRWQEDVLDLQPRAIVLCIGTNDLSAHADVADIRANIEALLAMTRAAQPRVPVVLCTVPPRDDPRYPTAPGAQEELNRQLKQLGGKFEDLVVLDLFRELARYDGGPMPEYFGADRLHLAEPGYNRWEELLRLALASLGVA